MLACIDKLVCDFCWIISFSFIIIFSPFSHHTSSFKFFFFAPFLVFKNLFWQFIDPTWIPILNKYIELQL